VPDPRVQAAIDNWAPRFVSQGVDFNDFLSTTATIERWEDWLGAWVETADVHRALAEEAEAAGNGSTAGEAYVRAALCYHFGKFVWLVDLDRHREATELAIACIYAAHRHLDPAAKRVDVPFDGETLVGNLRRPAGAAKPPLVLLLPGLDSTKEEFFNWEEVFLARGLATFSFDGPGQGESGFATQIRPDYEAAVSAALDALGWDGPVGAGRLQLRRVLGRAAAADAGGVRPPFGRRGRGGRPVEGARARSRAGDRRARPPGAHGHGQARPDHPLGADQTDRGRGPERAVRPLRGGQPRV